MQPDLAGFRAAQASLATAFGATVTFSIPPDADDVTWPDDTPLDPETGLPFDPVIEPESGGEATEVEATAQVVHRTVGQGDQTPFGPLGWVESADIALILSVDDKAEVEAATEVVVFGERQRVISFRPDGIQPDVVDRWLCFVEGM